jgi:uncharacterized protein (DUF2267 family)
MSETGLAAFDTTLQKTNIWLGDLMDALGTQDRRRAYRALRSTLHALRDRLPLHEAVEFAAPLPMLMRGLYFEGWTPTATARRPRTLDAFLGPIQDAFRDEDIHYAERAARAVFGVISAKFNQAEVEKLRHLLPAEVRELWRP